MISNGLVQSGAEMIGAETSSHFNLSQAFSTSLANRLVKGLAILLNSFMNLL